jgi:hypothetical protein
VVGGGALCHFKGNGESVGFLWHGTAKLLRKETKLRSHDLSSRTKHIK